MCGYSIQEGEVFYVRESVLYDTTYDYLLPFRQRSGEILTLKSPLWRLDFDHRDKAQVKNSTALSYDAIKSKIRHLLLRSNVTISKSITDENKIGRRRNEIKANHGFRKFAITQMGKNGFRNKGISRWA